MTNKYFIALLSCLFINTFAMEEERLQEMRLKAEQIQDYYKHVIAILRNAKNLNDAINQLKTIRGMPEYAPFFKDEIQYGALISDLHHKFNENPDTIMKKFPYMEETTARR